MTECVCVWEAKKKNQNWVGLVVCMKNYKNRINCLQAHLLWCCVTATKNVKIQIIFFLPLIAFDEFVISHSLIWSIEWSADCDFVSIYFHLNIFFCFRRSFSCSCSVRKHFHTALKTLALNPFHSFVFQRRSFVWIYTKANTIRTLDSLFVYFY